MRIIDFHTHIYPQKVAEKATASICNFYGLEGGGMCGTADQLIVRGDMAGISEFVVLPVAIKPDHVRSINHFISEQVAENNRFYGFGTVHAEMDNICEEIEYINSKGLLGIKMHPDTQLFNIDDERLFPMYKMIEGKFPVIFHTGDPRYDYSHPARVRRVLDKFPKLEVIAANSSAKQTPPSSQIVTALAPFSLAILAHSAANPASARVASRATNSTLGVTAVAALQRAAILSSILGAFI